MPGFLGGGSSGSSGAGGEIRFPKEFVDPVTKLRVSNPQNLIDTDFEYGLQPTKWETVELINNTPSFFSKSGDTTIPGILSITTNAGTREITVTTALDHGLAVGIPISVTGTKSVTADGAYIINSIPNSRTFTYLSRDNEPATSSIEDLYSSIITGEFFQGSQLRVADSSGITTDGESLSTLTVKTESTHGFGVKTPFYFLNLNSTISQEFQAANTAAKSFDASNSATAQTFDGSNTLSSIPVDWSNSATIGGTTSTISSVSTTANTITVAHGAENFVGLPIGTPLYYRITAGVGFFAANPFGVVFLKTDNTLGSATSTFQVSQVPDGEPITIESSLSGTFIVANQAKTFAGNNTNPLTQTNITVIEESPIVFDGGNQGFAGAIQTNGLCNVEGYSGTILVSTTPGAGLDYYVGAMLRYTTTGSAASGLVNNRTYFVKTFVANATPNLYNMTISEFPDTAALAPTGGTGTQTFTKIGVSIDKDIIHVRDGNFVLKDMVQYSFPEGGRFTVGSAAETKEFYFVQKVYDIHNFELSEALFVPVAATGGVISNVSVRGVNHRVHTFSSTGTTDFVVSAGGTVEYLIVAGGGGGGFQVGGGGGAGGLLQGKINLTAQTYPIVVGAGGNGALPNNTRSTNGGNSSAFGLSAVGGGGGASHLASISTGLAGGSGGGGSGNSNTQNTVGGAGTAGQGNAGGTGLASTWSGGGGGGAFRVGQNATSRVSGTGGNGGDGFSSVITGARQYYAGGGGGSWNNQRTEASTSRGGAGGGGRGLADNGDAFGLTAGENGAANTGGGGGGVRDYFNGSTFYSRAGNGGSGIVVVRYPTAPLLDFVAPVATGGTTSTITADGYVYRVHSFTNVGVSTFSVTNPGSFNHMEFLVVGGGGSGGGYVAGGGGGGGFTEGIFAAGVQNYTVTVGAGGAAGATSGNPGGFQGGTSSIVGTNLNLTAIGGGGGGNHDSRPGLAGASGGGAGSTNGASVSGGAAIASTFSGSQIVTCATYGFRGGNTTGSRPNSDCEGAGGGGAGGKAPDHLNTNTGPGGPGRPSSILGPVYYFCGGGGGGGYYTGDAGDAFAGNGGIGGGGGGGTHVTGSVGLGGGFALNSGQNGSGAGEGPGGAGGANTGGGGGGSGHNQASGTGGSGIVVIRYPIALA